MARKKLIQDQTKEEIAFEMATRIIGKQITSADARFYMKLTRIIEENADFKLSDVANLYDDIYNKDED